MLTTLTFLGVGSATQNGLGHASAVVEFGGARLLIDCGPGTLQAFYERYESLPDAVFITHCHLDHVGDFENLFIRSWFGSTGRHQPKIFIAASIVPLLNERVGNYPSVLAEGGVNFWDAFHLIPVSGNFIFNDIKFSVIPVRHHAPNTAYGLHLPGAFFYTGDTRPLPEVIQYSIGSNDMIFHDCAVVGNPSHTGIDDVLREYSPEQRKRMRFYHYRSLEEMAAFEEHGLRVVSKGERFEFSCAGKEANGA